MKSFEVDFTLRLQ